MVGRILGSNMAFASMILAFVQASEFHNEYTVSGNRELLSFCAGYCLLGLSCFMICVLINLD